jgi:hypothetical protein
MATKPRKQRNTKAWMLVDKAPSGDWCVVAPVSMIDGELTCEVHRTRRLAREARMRGERVVPVTLVWKEPK